jgi:hypothetical protein
MLAFEYATGEVTFRPTTVTSAACAPGQSFDVATIDFSESNVTVPMTTGLLALVGDTLFVSVHGTMGSAG